MADWGEIFRDAQMQRLKPPCGFSGPTRGAPWPRSSPGEARAARFMIAHPDYLEGIRARILDRDDKPRWQPATLEKVRW